MSFLRNSKAPAGMTTRRSGLLPQIIFAGCNLKAPAGMTTRRSGLLSQIILPDVIFEEFKGPCGHDNPSFGAFDPITFCRRSF